jgi:hypothetical protein
MSTFRNPVGPETPNVYWRRRLVVGIGALAVIVIILLIVFAPKGSKTPIADDTKTPSSSDTPAPGATADLKACAANDLTVVATVDKAKYTVEEQPQLGFTITNNGSAACNATVGSDVQVFTVTSGKETIWTSTDCQTAPVALVQAIEPGAQLTGGPVAWDRTRSSKSTCDTERTAVTGAGATYRLAVKVGDIAAKDDVPFILQ